MPFKAPERIVCVECDGVVYPMEKVTAGQYHYHQNCFQCAHCNRKLSLSNFVIGPSGIPYCKPHYNEILKQRGNFENFAIGRVSEPTDGTTSPSHSTEVMDADNKRIVTSTKPRLLKPINRQRSVSASSIAASATSTSSAAAAASSSSSPQKVDGSHAALCIKRSASLSAAPSGSSTVTSSTDASVIGKDMRPASIAEDKVEDNDTVNRLLADLQLCDGDDCTKL